jgi:putative redox protein
MFVTVSSETDGQSFRQVIAAGEHTLFSDLNRAAGGQGTAADPYDLLLGAWGSCTNMTLQLYAARKQWPLEKVSTELQKVQNGKAVTLKKNIRIWGAFTPEQLDRLKAIAEKCPVNQVITGQIEEKNIESTMEWMGKSNNAMLGSA